MHEPLITAELWETQGDTIVYARREDDTVTELWADALAFAAMPADEILTAIVEGDTAGWLVDEHLVGDEIAEDYFGGMACVAESEGFEVAVTPHGQGSAATTALLLSRCQWGAHCDCRAEAIAFDGGGYHPLCSEHVSAARELAERRSEPIRR